MKSPRLNLRKFIPSDLQYLTEMMTDLDVMRQTGFRSIQTPVQISTHFHKLLSLENNPYGIWAVESRADQDFIGWVMLQRTIFPEPEIGVMIRKSKWNQGHAYEALSCLISNFNEKKIHARCDHDNQKSIKILTKLGFKMTKNENGTLFFERD